MADTGPITFHWQADGSVAEDGRLGMPVSGYDKDGNHWFINLDSERERVWVFKHEGGYILSAEFESWEEYLFLLNDAAAYGEQGGATGESNQDADEDTD